MIVAVFCSWIVAFMFPGTAVYVSPLAILAAICGFSWFCDLKLPSYVAKCVVFLSPSMFGVYIVHECCVKSWQTLADGPGWLEVFGRTAMLFALGLAVDLVRRWLFHTVGKVAIWIKKGETC